MSASTSCKLFLKFNTFLIWNSKCKDASRIFSSNTFLVFSAAMLMVEVTQNIFSSLKVTFYNEWKKLVTFVLSRDVLIDSIIKYEEVKSECFIMHE